MKSSDQIHFFRNDVRLSYRIHGTGSDWLILCHALATDQSIWHNQVESFATTHRVLTFDLRGHGDSGAPQSNDYSFETQADDVAALMTHVGIEKAILVGVSVGGEVAQMTAVRHRSRVSSLILVSTACYTDGARAEAWASRIKEAEALGMAAIAPTMTTRWFSQDFARLNPAVIDAYQTRIAQTHASTYIGLANVISRMDLRPLIRSIACPTLIVYGAKDLNTGTAAAMLIQECIPGSRVSVLEGAGHFPNVELPASFNELLTDFLGRT